MVTIVTEQGVRAPQVLVPVAGSLPGEARLGFDNGLEHVDLRAGETGDALLTGAFSDPLPVVWAAGNNVHVAYRVGSRLLRVVGRNTIRLNPAASWALDVHGGASKLSADLTGVDVRSVAFHSGAARIRLALGAPTGPRPIRLGAVKDLRIERPAGVPVRLEIIKGAVKVTVDGRRFGAVGGGLSDQTDGYRPDAPHYLVTVAGGADTVTIAGT